ncbi:MAG: dUTP diphosphatase [Alphaproteobacteria bacterium]|nr:dUTP diphosphatase [Alphaproteobacteria bacterium]
MKVSIKVLGHGKGLALPSYATCGSAGMDLRAAISEDVVLKRFERRLIPTGVSVAIPEGYNITIRPRSGLALKHGVTVFNTPGTVDCDYRGELKVLLVNFGEEDFTVERGMRIAQMVLERYDVIEWHVTEELEETCRSCGGYGSTGVR